MAWWDLLFIISLGTSLEASLGWPQLSPGPWQDHFLPCPCLQARGSPASRWCQALRRFSCPLFVPGPWPLLVLKLSPQLLLEGIDTWQEP